MDAKVPYSYGYENGLPVLSRSRENHPYTAPHPELSNVAQKAPLPTLTAQTSAQTPAPETTTAATATKDRKVASKVRKSRKATNASASASAPGKKPTKSTLFWVNTDQKTVSTGSSKEETLKRIRSHVMSEHNRKKRLESTKDYKAKTWKQLDFQPPEKIIGPSSTPVPALTSDTRRASYVHAIKQEFIPTTTVGYFSPATTATATAWEDEYEYQYEEVVRHHTRARPSIWSHATIGSGANDPFNAGHTQMTDRMLSYLHNFLWDLTQQAHPLQRGYKNKLHNHWAALVQRDPAILHATICMSTSNAAMQRGELPMRDPNQHRSTLVLDSFHHRGETIRLVNEGLSDPIKAASDELIAAVSTLLTIEIASGNPDYLKIHLAGLRQMVALRKNFADVAPDIRFQISWTDIRVASMAMTRPIFPFVRSARPLGLALIPPTDDALHLATRLMPLIKIPGIFDEAFSKTIYDLVELAWYAEWIKSNVGQKDFDDETEDYFNFEVLSVEYSLYADRFTPTGQLKCDNSIEGCCRLAALCFHNSAIWSFYPMIAPLLPKPILTLRSALEATIPTDLFGFCQDVLVWLLFMGAACAQVMPNERTYFVSELANATSLMGVTSWQECRQILLGFFYTDRIHLPMLRQIWHEVEAQIQVEPLSA